MLEAYDAAKRTEQRLDYDDLIYRTRDLLAGEDMTPWVLFKLDGGLDVRQNPHLGGDGHRHLRDEPRDQAPHERRLRQEEGTVAALLGAALRTTEIQVDAVARALHKQRRGPQLLEV